MLNFHNYKQLLPAVEKYKKDTSANIEIRKSAKVHDRWYFIDGALAYISGASSKDAAASKITSIIPVNSFAQDLALYQKAWDEALELYALANSLKN